MKSNIYNYADCYNDYENKIKKMYRVQKVHLMSAILACIVSIFSPTLMNVSTIAGLFYGVIWVGSFMFLLNHGIKAWRLEHKINNLYILSF